MTDDERSDDLSATVEALKARIELLERSAPGAARVKTPLADQERLSRRSLLVSGGVAAAGGVAALAGLGAVAPATAAAASSTGNPLVQFMDFNASGIAPALSSDVTFTRQDPAGVGPGFTNEILSLVSVNSQTNSYAWPLFVQMRGTTSATSDINSSQSVGVTSQVYNRSGGNGTGVYGSSWVTSFHAETHHGEDIDGSTFNTYGTTLGVNVELTRKSGNGTAIGMELLMAAGKTSTTSYAGNAAIQIDSAKDSGGWSNGIHFVAGKSGYAGNIGVNFDASYQMGIDLKDNSLRMNADQRFLLEGSGSAFIRFNSANGKIEIVKGYSTVVASW